MALKDTLDFYTSLYHDCGIRVNKQNQLELLRYEPGKGDEWEITAHPAIITLKGKELPVVHPIREEQEKPEGTNILFHPLHEAVDRGEGATLKMIRGQMDYIVHHRFVQLLMLCGRVLSTKSIQEKLSPTQGELLTQCSNYNDNTYQIMLNLLKRSRRSDVSMRPIGLFIKTAKQFRGEPCRRVCTVASPLWHACHTGQKEIWGLKNLPKKHTQAIADLIEFILPGFGDEEFCHGSDSKLAPMMDALLRVYAKLNHRFDKLDKLFGEYGDKGIPLELDYEWEKSINKIGSLRNPIEPQTGNIGPRIASEQGLGVTHEIRTHEVRGEDVDDKPPFDPDPPKAPVRGQTVTTQTLDDNAYQPAKEERVAYNPAARQQHRMQPQIQQQPAYHQQPQQHSPYQQVQPQQPTSRPYQDNGGRVTYTPPAQQQAPYGQPYNHPVRRGRP